jgi:hypothetical protein
MAIFFGVPQDDFTLTSGKPKWFPTTWRNPEKGLLGMSVRTAALDSLPAS